MAAKVINLNDVWAMLDKCAPGYGRKESEHFHRVTYQGKTFRALPLGAHGKRKNPEIEAGHVRSMARHLEIEKCCREQLPDIWGTAPEADEKKGE